MEIKDSLDKLIEKNLLGNRSKWTKKKGQIKRIIFMKV